MSAPDQIHAQHSCVLQQPRGIVACANQNEPHTNLSQFFISLDKCDWLDRKNTIFGKVVGDTIFNLARLNELDVSVCVCPLYVPYVPSNDATLWVVWSHKMMPE